MRLLKEDVLKLIKSLSLVQFSTCYLKKINKTDISADIQQIIGLRCSFEGHNLSASRMNNIQHRQNVVVWSKSEIGGNCQDLDHILHIKIGHV